MVWVRIRLIDEWFIFLKLQVVLWVIVLVDVTDFQGFKVRKKYIFCIFVSYIIIHRF